MLYEVEGLRLPLGEDATELARRIAERLGCRPDDLREVTILRRSLDARGRHPHYDLVARVELASGLPALPGGVRPWTPTHLTPLPTPSAALRDETVAIVGAGPCGLFAALTLADRGIRSVVFERGEPVDVRAKSVSRLMGRSQLDPESNLCFGEGGAGTWSDGKLYTRIGGEDVARVLQRMVDLGAPTDILVDRRPHLGTDRLVGLLKGIRRHLEAHGVAFHFRSRVVRLERRGRRGILHLADGNRFEADRVVLAMGHSARDLFESLRRSQVAMLAKPFAVGFRAEHPQQLINRIQFGDCVERMEVPAAEYRLALTHGRGERAIRVHSFCMCPGGSIVPTATRPGEVCVNGMSHAARSGHYANAALVTVLLPEELGDDLFAGVEFQVRAERMAYELGGGGFAAPAARLVDYLAGRGSAEIRRTTYRCGVRPADLRPCYPDSVHERLRAGIRHFERRMRGFISDESVLLGVETRTSSPIRVVRNEALRSVSHDFVYPGGEGAGYAGGITSSAVDGVRIGRRILGA